MDLEEEQEQKTYRKSKNNKGFKRRDRSPASLPLVQGESDHLGSTSFTKHGEKRRAQRNLSRQDIEFVLQHGVWIRKTGVDFVHLRLRDIPEEHLVFDAINRLEGVTVLITSESTIATCYRNKRALRDIRHKRDETIAHIGKDKRNKKQYNYL